MDLDTTTRKVLTRQEVRRMVDRRLVEYVRMLKMELPEAVARLTC
jgi:hypothetical protein